jgi:TRAP transporter TAXI family solute receptor
MREVADVVARHGKGIVLDVYATRDPSENMAMLNRGAIDLGAIRSDTPVVSDIQMVAELYSDYFQLIVRGDSDAREFTDIGRLKIGIPDFGTDAFRSFWTIADHYNFALDQIDWTAIDFTAARGGLISGRFDAIFTVRSLRDADLLRLFLDAAIKKLDLRYIPMRQAQAVALKKPFLKPAIIPEGAVTSARPIPLVPTPTATVSRMLVTRDDVPDAAIRELTRVLFEHRLDLTIRFSLASAIRQPDESAGLNVPLHEGASQFYDRDQPSYLKENAEPLALVLTIFAMGFSAMLALRNRFVAAQKNRADRYNYQLLDLHRRTLEAQSPAELAQIKQEVNATLATVVVALDTDEVTDEGFQSFALLLETVRDTVRDRQGEFVDAQRSETGRFT